jgi:hypothetical protein
MRVLRLARSGRNLAVKAAFPSAPRKKLSTPPASSTSPGSATNHSRDPGSTPRRIYGVTHLGTHTSKATASVRSPWPPTWWAVQDLNLWPLPCQGSALPLS